MWSLKRLVFSFQPLAQGNISRTRESMTWPEPTLMKHSCTTSLHAPVFPFSIPCFPWSLFFPPTFVTFTLAFGMRKAFFHPFTLVFHSTFEIQCTRLLTEGQGWGVIFLFPWCQSQSPCGLLSVSVVCCVFSSQSIHDQNRNTAGSEQKTQMGGVVWVLCEWVITQMRWCFRVMESHLPRRKLIASKCWLYAGCGYCFLLELNGSFMKVLYCSTLGKLDLRWGIRAFLDSCVQESPNGSDVKKKKKILA